MTGDRDRLRSQARSEAVSALIRRYPADFARLYAAECEHLGLAAEPPLERLCWCGGTVQRSSPSARWPATCEECQAKGITQPPEFQYVTCKKRDRPAAAPVKDGRSADSARRRERVVAVLETAEAAGTEITREEVARLAGVSLVFLYRHRELLDRVHRIQPAGVRRVRVRT